MKYDVFISYRRKGGVDVARSICAEFINQGLAVFFDYDEIKDDVFEKKILDAIDDAPVFCLILSPNALDRCVSKTDWVRKEIEYAISKEKHFIPITFDNDVVSYPWRFPKEIKEKIKGIQYSTIHRGSLFTQSVQKIVTERIKPVLITRFLDPQTLYAVRRHPLFPKCKSFDKNKAAHAIIWGFGNKGVSLLRTLCLTAHFPNRSTTRITIIDKELKTKFEDLRNNLPELFKLIDWRFIDINDYIENQYFRLKDPVDFGQEKWRRPLRDEVSNSPYKSKWSENFSEIELDFIEGDVFSPAIQDYLQITTKDQSRYCTIFNTIKTINNKDAEIRAYGWLKETYQVVSIAPIFNFNINADNSENRKWDDYYYLERTKDFIYRYNEKCEVEMEGYSNIALALLKGYNTGCNTFNKDESIKEKWDEYDLDRKKDYLMDAIGLYQYMRDIAEALKNYSEDYSILSLYKDDADLENKDLFYETKDIDTKILSDYGKEYYTLLCILRSLSHRNWVMRMLLTGFRPTTEGEKGERAFKTSNYIDKHCNVSPTSLIPFGYAWHEFFEMEGKAPDVLGQYLE